MLSINENLTILVFNIFLKFLNCVNSLFLCEKLQYGNYVREYNSKIFLSLLNSL